MMQRRTAMNLLWLAAVILFCCALFWPLLFGENIVTHKDIRTYTYPLVQLVQERLWTRDVFWNNLNGFGFPSFLSDGYAMNPLLTFLLMFLSPFQATHWTVIVSCIAGAFFCMKLLQQWGFSGQGSFLAGLTYALALWPWIFNPSTALVTAALPLMLLLVTRENIPTWIRYAGGIATMSFLLLCGFPHYVVIASIAMGIVVCTQALRDPRRFRSPVLKRFAVILGVSGIISLIRFIPLFAMSALSTRTDSNLLEQLGGIGWNLPFYMLFQEPRTPHLTGNLEISPYIGLVPLLCVFVALFNFRKQPVVKLCLSVLGISLLLAGALGFLLPLLRHLPLYASLGSPSRWLYLGKLAMIPLIAFGFDAFLQGVSKKRERILSVCCMLPAILLVLGMLLLPQDTNAFLGESRLYLPKNIMTFFILFAMGVILLPALWMRLGRMRAPVFAVLGAATLLFGYVPMINEGTVERERLVLPSITHESSKSYIQILTFLPSEKLRQLVNLPEVIQTELQSFYTSASSVLLQPNQNIYIGLSSASIYEPLNSRRVSLLLAAIGSESQRVPTEAALSSNSLPLEENISLFQRRQYLLDSLGITDVFSSFELKNIKLTEAGRGTILGHVPVLTNYGVLQRQTKIPQILYFNPTSRLFTYFAQNIVFSEPNGQRVYEAMLSEPWPSDRTFVECPGCAGTFVSPHGGAINLKERSPTYLLIETTSPGEQWLVISRSYLPGWSVTVDDKEAQPALAQSIFFAIHLSPGDHEVKVRFSLPRLLSDSLALLSAPEESLWLQ